jgi:hypothetical protein
MSAAETTTDHDVIRQWIEERGGKPSVVEATEHNGQPGGLLRVDFRNPDDKFDDIEWDEFFKIFENNKLAFLHQDQTADGKTSRFTKFIAREGK